MMEKATLSYNSCIALLVLTICGPWFISSQFLAAYDLGYQKISYTALLLPFGLMGFSAIFRDGFSGRRVPGLLMALIVVVLLSSFLSVFWSEAFFVDALIDTFQGFILICSCYYLGRYIDTENTYSKSIIACYFILATIIFIVISITEQSIFGPLVALNRYLIENPGAVSYQGVARAFSILMLLLFMCPLRKVARLFCIFLSIYLFFAIGSRQYMLLALIFLLLEAKTASLAIIIGLSLMPALDFFEIFADSRLLDLLDWESSESVSVRAELSASSADLIADMPFLGNFGYYKGPSSGYAHNILFTWANYGLASFLLHLSLLLVFIVAYFDTKRHCRSRTAVFHALIIFVVGQALFMQPITAGTLTGLLAGLLTNPKLVKDI